MRSHGPRAGGLGQPNKAVCARDTNDDTIKLASPASPVHVGFEAADEGLYEGIVDDCCKVA